MPTTKTATPTGPLASLLEPWESTLRVRSPHTARSYRTCVERFLAAVGGRLDTFDATSSAESRGKVARYLDSLSDLAPASRAHHVSAVRSFLAFAQHQHVLDEGPRDLLVRPKVAVTSFGRYLDEGELRRLVDAARECSPRHHATVMLLFGCGLRVSEAVSAVWRDLYRDPDGCLGLRVVGKGSKERVVLVPDATFRALAALHGSDRLDAKDRSPLLVSSRGGPYTDRQLRRLVDQAAKAAGLDKAVSPHWLRHTSATLAARHGAPAYAIQASLGHTSLATSQRYVHWAKGLEGQATGYLDAVLAG